MISNLPVVLACAALALAAPSEDEESLLAFVQVPAVTGEVPANASPGEFLLSRYPSGARLLLAELGNVASSIHGIASGFESAGEPSFHPGGEKLCFAGRRSADRSLSLWEVDIEGGETVALFESGYDCISPIYSPNRRIVFASQLAGEYEEHGGDLSFSLHEWSARGTEARRLTFNPSSEIEPAFLPDGRIVFSSWQHVGNHFWPRGVFALMLVNSDGTGIFPLTGNHRLPWLKRGATPLGSERVVFVRADRAGTFGAGELVAVSLDDPFGVHEVLVPRASFEVADAAPTPAGDLVLAARPTDGSRPTFGLYLWRGGELELLFDDPLQHELSPALVPAAAPERRISTVVPGKESGQLLVLDCRESDRVDQGDPRAKPVAAVRVIEGLPLHHERGGAPSFLTLPGREDEPRVHAASATGTLPSRILGEVAPAADGSLYLEVPADRPLRLQLLDREGFAIVNERAWFWVRPGERRVCIGCHEDRELAPRNAAPLAVADEPVDLSDERGWRTVSFQRDLRPILEATCSQSGCHSSPTPTAGMSLMPASFSAEDVPLAERFGAGYANLLARQQDKPFAVGGRRVHPGDAHASPLMWMLYGEALEEPYAPAPFERPIPEFHPDEELTPVELELFRTWIDLGAPYDIVCPPGPWPHAVSTWAPPLEEEDDR